MPGFKDAHIYPFTPDVPTARRPAGGQRRTAILYTCNSSPCDQLAQIAKTNLGAIGIDVVVKAFPIQVLAIRLSRSGEPFDLAFTLGWAADYPDPDDFLNHVLESGAGTVPGFHDPVYTPRLAAAARLSGPRRYLAYGKLDADLARNAAPWVAIGSFTSQDFFSARIGCQVYQPVYGMDIAALCIRH